MALLEAGSVVLGLDKGFHQGSDRNGKYEQAICPADLPFHSPRG
jgi:hypothetical protein